MTDSTFFCSSASVANATPASDIVPCSANVSNSETPTVCVGQTAHGCLAECRADGTKVPPQAEVEAELDHAISQLADAAVAAEAQGDKTGARIYVRRMYAAIQSRTPEHQARLNYESLARIA